MQMLKLSLLLPDDAHPDMELRMSTSDTECDVVITMAPARAGMPRASSDEPSGAEACVLGGYAGI
ncbi:MAG TPA: hypothetical protein VJR95_08960 [Rhodanobacter sp.]|nr:hypothetical protein [Rhodanobacter sp.]